MNSLLARFSSEELEEFSQKAEQGRQSLARALLQANRIDERDYLEFCARHYELEFVPDLCALAFEDGTPWHVDADLIRSLPLGWARRMGVVPLRNRSGKIVLALRHPEDMQHGQDIAFICGERPESYILAREVDINSILNRVFGEDENSGQTVADMLGQENTVELNEDSVEDLLEESSDAPFIRTVNLVLAQALRAGASDIHIEPYRDSSRVRFRLDGVLYERHTLQKAHHAALVSRIKVMARLDIAEKRLPQDGRIAITLGGRQAGLRVSTLPTSFGERVVLRLLEKNERILSLGELGLAKEDFRLVSDLVTAPHGIVLVTGPTGSGKTTTLYAALQEISSPDKNILTIEDPVEYELDGVGQMQVNPKINLNFADGLRAIVRQDPDVILIGEIRDGETASIAVQSALTGHLVFSTLHTNDAPGAVTRLFDMGVEPFLLSSVLRGVIAQRLVRVLCPHCAQAVEADPSLLARLDRAGISGRIKLKKPMGCEACMDTGYRGRMAIYELMPISESIRNLIVCRADANALRKQALDEGMCSLAVDGLRKVAQGLTSLEEVERVVRA